LYGASDRGSLRLEDVRERWREEVEKKNLGETQGRVALAEALDGVAMPDWCLW